MENVRALMARGEWNEGRADVSLFPRGLIPPPEAQMSVADAEARTAAAPPEPSGRPRIERLALSIE
jgi:hypothetical protein